MILKQPTSVDECVYFTNRVLDKGKIKAWVLKGLCPKCSKSLMGKPKDPKTGKTQIRAKEYVCQECGFRIEQKEYEDSLTCNVQYACPYCSFSGEIQIPFKRKKTQIFDEEEQKKKTIDSLRFQCQKCNRNIDITKKLK